MLSNGAAKFDIFGSPISSQRTATWNCQNQGPANEIPWVGWSGILSGIPKTDIKNFT